MTQTLAKSLTLDEFLSLPETEPASEYIDGEVIQKPMPQGKHSRIQYSLCKAINDRTEPTQTAVAFPELRCTFGGRSIVPDLAVFTWSRLPLDEQGEFANVFKAAPDWLIEILSPEQSQTQVTRKILHSLEHGCQLGWLVDPAEKTVLVYPVGGQTRAIEGEDTLPVLDNLPLSLTVSEMMGWLKPIAAPASDSQSLTSNS